MYAELARIKCQILVDNFFLRQEELNMCKTQEEKDRLRDRWAIEDAAERVASAIESASRRNDRPRFLGIF